jgi:hypothetical protein
VKLGRLKSHLGTIYEWKQDKSGNTYLEAFMPQMIDEISEKFEQARGKKAKEYATTGTPGKTLKKNEGNMVDIDAYRSIVGKIMYNATKIAPEICNAVRELAGHLSNPGEEHWKALERCVGYLTIEGTKPLCLRKPRVLQSISDCDSDYAEDENDRKSISGRINTLGVMTTNWKSQKQNTVSLSSSEAQYQALSECVQESVFTKKFGGVNRKEKTRHHK